MASMAALLDTIVPSRRREKRRLLALEERLNTRFGDPSISAPTEGGWNTYRPDRDVYEDTSPAFLPLSPVKEAFQDSLETLSGQIEAPRSDVQHEEKQKEVNKQQASLTVTIPLPWKRFQNRSASNNQEPAPPKDAVTSPLSHSQTASPSVVLYKPASEEYRRELDRSLNHQATSPAVLYKPASEDYRRTLDGLANRPSRIQAASPYESVPEQDDQQRHLSTSTAGSPGSHLDSEGGNSDTNDTTSVTSCDQATSDTVASTPPADQSIPDEIVKGMASFGLCPSPSLQGVRDRRSASLGAPRRSTYRESVSSSSSGDSGSNGLSSPRGLHLATMSSGVGYYANLAQEYKQIAKTVENDVVADYKMKAATRTAAQRKNAEAALNSGSLQERQPPVDYEQRRAASKERRRDQSVERTKRQPELIMAAPYTGRDKGRAQSVDRYRRSSHDRPPVLLKDTRRGVSVERPRPRATSKDRFGPQELVPQADELWG